MKIYCARKSSGGTTLPEVILAVAILAIMAAGIITSFNYGFFVMRLARENQRATQIIMEKAETIRLYNWDQINAVGYISNAFTEVYDPQAPAGSQGVTYHGTLNLTNVDFSPLPAYSTNLKQVTVTVTWQSGAGGITRTRHMSTLVAKDGIQNYVY
jgi:type II secretory pathway pseudopilin PulG